MVESWGASHKRCRWSCPADLAVAVCTVHDHKASIPRKPTTPANPAPKATRVCDAAPVDSGSADAVALPLPLADRVAEWTEETVVLFEPVGIALTELMLALALALALGVTRGAGVVEASVAAGYSWGRMLLTSAGSDAYQPGVLPASSDEAMSAAKAEEEASARLRWSGGSAVASTSSTELATSGLETDVRWVLCYDYCGAVRIRVPDRRLSGRAHSQSGESSKELELHVYLTQARNKERRDGPERVNECGDSKGQDTRSVEQRRARPTMSER
jgi:hypothetical protein